MNKDYPYSGCWHNQTDTRAIAERWTHDFKPPSCPPDEQHYLDVHVNYVRTFKQVIVSGSSSSPLVCTRTAAPDWVIPSPGTVQVSYQRHSCPALHPIGPIDSEGQTWCYNIAGSKKQPKICEGNPVSVADGVKLHNEVVFTGNGQHPLTLNLSYSSDLGRWSSVFDLYFDVASKALREEGGRYVQYQYVGERRVHGTTRKVWQTANSQNLLLEDTAGYWQLQRDNGRFEVYNQQGYLQQISFGDKPTIVQLSGDSISLKPSGIAHSYSYTGNKLIKITHTNGRTLNFTWDGERINSATDDAANEYLFSYNTQGMLGQISWPDGRSKSFLYENSANPGVLTGISLNGVRYAWYEYDEQGKTITSRHFADNYKHSFEYGETQTSVINPLDKRTTYHYADVISGQLDSIAREQSSYCAGGAQDYSYDSRERKETVTDWNDNTSRFEYYDNDKIKSITEADGSDLARKTQYQWQPEGNKLTAIERDGIKHSFTYDNTGNLTGETLSSNGKSRTTQYSNGYYANHIMVSRTVIAPNGGQTRYQFDSKGNLTTTISASGQITKYSQYDTLGNPATVTHPDGTVVALTYGATGQILTEQHYAKGQTAGSDTPFHSVRYSYNRFGHVSSIVSIPDTTSYFFYDLAGRLVAEQHIVSNSAATIGATLYQHDKLGNVILQRYVTELQLASTSCDEQQNTNRLLVTIEPLDAIGPVSCAEVTGVTETFRQHYAYTELGKLREISDAAGNVMTSYSYDANGNMTAMTDALGNVTTYQYDALNRLVSEQAPDDNFTFYNWQGDVLNKVTDSRNNATEYQLATFQEVANQISPDSGSTVYEYDTSGNVIASTDARALRTTFSWDADGRLKTKINSTSHNWQYNTTTGQLTGISDDSGSTSWQYNTAGQLSSQTALINGSSYALNWAYNSYQRPGSLTYPGGNQVSYEYNTANQLSAVTVSINGQQLNLLSNISTLPYGPIAGWQYGNGLNRSYSYDLNYRLTGITTPGIQQLAYSYSNNQISAISNQLNSAQSQSFSYDNLSRLTSVGSTANGQDDYSYDSLGNRLSRSGNVNEIYDIDPLSNRLLSVSRGEQQRSFSYDANGNVINETGFDGSLIEYSYNDDNRMISAGNSTYQYNALGQRVAKAVNGVSTHFIYSPDGQLLAEGTTKQYIYVYGQLVGYINNNQLYYVHNDHLGRPEVITDQSKAVVWQAKLEAFDRTVLHSNIGDFNIGFPGQYWDEEKQSWYNYFRDYDATTGRYLQSDPIGLAAGVNTYIYVKGNPVRYTDFWGLDVDGVWTKRAYPQVYDFSVQWGDARRPNNWWKIWENGATYRAMEQKVSVNAGFDWQVRCSCDGNEWDISGATIDWVDVYVPVFTPVHPTLGKYTTLTNATYNLLIKPATNEALIQASGWAKQFHNNHTASELCKANSR
ncbi:RHS repeat-associated core domain-containing protein [Rheinheimera pacifica]|uniref:RHS repeat-associated core domain-containing protein n=1 Tax=Rheinheimera pacifica TaxID=173990 RepID=UPI002EDAE734